MWLDNDRSIAHSYIQCVHALILNLFVYMQQPQLHVYNIQPRDRAGVCARFVISEMDSQKVEASDYCN